MYSVVYNMSMRSCGCMHCMLIFLCVYLSSLIINLTPITLITLTLTPITPYFQGQVSQRRSGVRIARLHTSTPQGARQVYSYYEGDDC